MHANIKLESTELLVDFGAGGWGGGVAAVETRQDEKEEPHR